MLLLWLYIIGYTTGVMANLLLIFPICVTTTTRVIWAKFD